MNSYEKPNMGGGCVKEVGERRMTEAWEGRTNMRTIVDLPKDQLEALDRLCDERKVSRAELILDAIKEYLQEHLKEGSEGLPGFGSWKEHAVDGLEYQRQIRAEWDR